MEGLEISLLHGKRPCQQPCHQLHPDQADPCDEPEPRRSPDPRPTLGQRPAASPGGPWWRGWWVTPARL